MVLVEYWGCGVRHIQLLLLVICCIVAAILIRTLDAALVLVEHETRFNNFTLYDDAFRHNVKTWTTEQKYILKNGSTVTRFFAALIAGLYSTKWNLKYFLLLDFCALSVQSYMIPFIAKKVAYDYLFLIVLLQGFCYGMIHPVTTAILARWTPTMEVGRTVTLVLSSRFFGYFCVYSLAKFLRSSLAGWHTLFYIVGNLGLLWCVAWFTFGFQDPKGCFYLSSEERNFIHSNIENLTNDTRNHSIPWVEIFRSPPLYGVLITLVSSTWIFEVITETTLPVDYFHDHNQKSLSTTLQLQYVVPTAMPLLQFIAAFVVDTLVGKKVFPLSCIRKTCNSIGCWIASLALLWLAYDPGWTLKVIFYFVFLFMNIFRFLGSNLVFYDLTRNYSGLLHGIVDFITYIPLAFYIPMMSLTLRKTEVPNPYTESIFRTLWYAGGIGSFVGNFIYIVINTRDKTLEKKLTPNPERESIISEARLDVGL